MCRVREGGVGEDAGGGAHLINQVKNYKTGACPHSSVSAQRTIQQQPFDHTLVTSLSGRVVKGAGEWSRAVGSTG